MLNREMINSITQEVIENRRWLHKNAELSFKEVDTANYIENKLREYGYTSIERICPTAIVTKLLTGKPGKVIALRADIDALPLTEKNNLPFASKNPGVMHACGHDGHTAILLGVAKYMIANKNSICGEIRFIFQHAEETPPGGGIELIKAGVMDGVDEVFGLHLTSVLETGKFGICYGPLTSFTDSFSILVQGKGGHSSMPQECIDPIIISAQIILALQNIASRMITPNDPFVLSVCEIQAGSAYNIIPHTSELKGSVRSFTAETRYLAEERIGALSTQIAAAYGATVNYEYKKGYDSVYNNPQLAAFAAQIVEQEFSSDSVVEMKPIMPGDDFGYYAQICPGFFLQLGAANKAKGITAPHHNPNYLMDEDALGLGLRYFCLLLERRLEIC